MQTGDLLADHRLPGKKAVFSALSPDGSFFLRADGESAEFRQIDARTGDVLGTFGAFEAPVTVLALSPDGTGFAAMDKTGQMGLWIGGKLRMRFHGKPGLIRNLRISYDNNQLAFSIDNRIYLVDVKRGRAEGLNIPFDNLLNFTVNLRFNRLVACGDRDGYILYDLENRRVILHESYQTVRMRVMNIVSACFLPNDRFICYSSIKEIWPLCPEQHKWIMGFLAAYTQLVVNIGFSPNWKYMAFRNSEGDLRVWRCAYICYVPSPAGSGEEERSDHRTRFIRAMSSSPNAVGAPSEALLRELEEVFRDPSAVRAFAAVRHNAEPEKTADALLPDFMRELRDRGFGAVGEDRALKALREFCPAAQPPDAGEMDDLLATLERETKERMKKPDQKSSSDSGLDDLLADLEREARKRRGNQPK